MNVKFDIRIDDLIKLYDSGKTTDEIIKIYNCSKSTIFRILRLQKISLVKNIDIDKLSELYRDGMLISEISKYFKCSEATIRYRLNKHNIELKTNKVYFKPEKGQKFNRLEFIEEVESKDNKRFWKCVCDCGKIKDYDYYTVIKGNTKSCGCYLKDTAKNHNWTGYKDISGGYWKSLLKGAKKRGIDFKISMEYAWTIFEEQNKKCNLSGMPIEFETRKMRKKDKYIASLDRIDNNKGYIEGNVQWVIKEINYMKNTLDEDKFIELCKKISEKQNAKYHIVLEK